MTKNPSIQITVDELRDDTEKKPGEIQVSRAVTFNVKHTSNGLEISDKRGKFLLVVSVYEGKISLLGWDENAKPEEPSFIHDLVAI